MKILAVADAEDRALADHFDPQRWKDVDLLISCGDIKPGYLDYLVTRLGVPCYYVRGNHDAIYGQDPPGGCESLDGRVVRFNGLRIGGLEGARWYGGQGVEYGDTAMAWKTLKLRLKIKLAGGVDLLVSHAPPVFPEGTQGAVTDRVHTGFEAFNRLIEAHGPRVWLHGHTHLGYGRAKREVRIGGTRVVDCYGSWLLEL